MPRTRKPQPTDVPETILDQFAGPARPLSQGEVDAITKRLKKALVDARRRADASSGLPTGRGEAAEHRESAQRDQRQDGTHRGRSVTLDIRAIATARSSRS